MENLNKVLITGATGFIGSHLTQRLIHEGFEVGIIKRERSDAWRIKDLLDKIVVYDVDLRDTQEVSKAVSHFRPDVIFHLATYYAVEHESQEVSLMVDTNVLGTVNLLEASKESIVKLFVNTSSCFVYKESENKLRENDDLSPLNLYALTKIHAEQACSFYAEKYGLKAITFRLFPPYGPTDHEKRLIPYVIKSLLDGERLKLTTGGQRWDFVYVEDIVDAYFKLLSIPDLSQKHDIFNIGTENAISVREVVSRIKDIIGSELEPDWGVIPHRKNEVWFTCADMSKSKNILRWQSKIQILEEGLEFTVEWYKKFWKKGR
ncbi:MAG: GDP-L-fucose synthase [Candidatus Argoarchaeum ethanivorans]|uniref:GDP-L-fucose synthase n=1 Tax=Candidatus Argoarchaeum ethanivorans TaxID=2608793 RepID=A0A811T736_9EURY|nr:MAG: GDP-L-fucose synthase [Candidatus Argoarchaeum ethanivorans]